MLKSSAFEDNGKLAVKNAGKCTPPGDWHHYTLTLIATDLDPNALEPGLTRDQLFEKLNGHTKGAAGLIGRFTKP
jgi:phosphatidylethanolamine-binding protein (PEBP) family uncharacterized protein